MLFAPARIVISPSSVSSSHVPVVLASTRKAFALLLRTAPVHLPGPDFPPAKGTLVMVAVGVPSGELTLYVPVLLLQIQKGLTAMPQGFTMFGSVKSASSGTSEARLCWTYPVAAKLCIGTRARKASAVTKYIESP